MNASTCLLCAEGYYQLGKYKECIEWCNQIIAKAEQSMNTVQEVVNKANLLKGKALYHSYQKEQLRFMKERRFISEQEVHHRIKHVYSKTKEAIVLLGNALDNDFLDGEGSKLLDFAMMDYMRETNQLNDCQRCLLCREKQKKNDICKSHFIPKSILKKIGKDFVVEGDHKYLLPMEGRITMKSPGECTFWMLCRVCEQRLSQNGEAIFMEKFFSKVYGDQGPILDGSIVPYEKWLYDFCIGIIFRGLATERFASVMNVDEVYNAFLVCRDHIKKLPAKTAAVSSPSASLSKQEGTGDDSLLKLSGLKIHVPEKDLEISLLINPVSLKDDGDSLRLKQLAVMLQTTGSPFLSTARLGDGKPALSNTAHFFAAHFGNCNIITKFQPSKEVNLPSWSLVDPNKGVYIIHDETQRWGHFPPGFWSAQLAATYSFQQVTLGYFTRAKSRHQTGKGSPASQKDEHITIEPETLNQLEVSDIFPSMESVPEVDRSFFTDFCRAPFVINHLPKGYVTTTFVSGFISTIHLPPGHQFVLHAKINNNEGRFTTVLMVTNENHTTISLIGVFSGQRGQIIDWVEVKTGNWNESTCTLKSYPEADASLERETQQRILQELPNILKARGFYSFSSVLQQISCR